MTLQLHNPPGLEPWALPLVLTWGLPEPKMASGACAAFLMHALPGPCNSPLEPPPRLLTPLLHPSPAMPASASLIPQVHTRRQRVLCGPDRLRLHQHCLLHRRCSSHQQRQQEHHILRAGGAAGAGLQDPCSYSHPAGGAAEPGQQGCSC